MEKHSGHVLGLWGERLVAEWFLWQGYTVVDRQLLTPYGELDLWVRLGIRHYLIEVKTRTHRQINQAPFADGLTPAKTRRLAAMRYFLQNQSQESGEWFCSFVVVVPGRILWLPHIFDPRPVYAECAYHRAA